MSGLDAERYDGDKSFETECVGDLSGWITWVGESLSSCFYSDGYLVANLGEKVHSAKCESYLCECSFSRLMVLCFASLNNIFDSLAGERYTSPPLQDCKGWNVN
jgi:hypothetical protein